MFKRYALSHVKGHVKDLYTEISAHFGIESVENLIADRRNRQLFMSDVALTGSFV